MTINVSRSLSKTTMQVRDILCKDLLSTDFSVYQSEYQNNKAWRNPGFIIKHRSCLRFSTIINFEAVFYTSRRSYDRSTQGSNYFNYFTF